LEVNMTGWKRRTAIAVAAMVAVGVSAARTDAAGVVATSLLLPLSGQLFVPPNPCAPSGDQVTVSGFVHTVTAVVPSGPVQPQPTFRVFLNMADVSAVGSTQTLYIGTGAFQQANIPFVPSGPIMPTFQLQGTAGCMSTALPVNVNLNFDASGNLLDTSSATLALCNSDHPC
jgi:hypothetical protein